MSDLQIQTRRDDIRRTRAVAAPERPLAPGEARLRVRRFALTANNVTYAASGDVLRYWQFFPVDEEWGLTPVWGFAEVERSLHPDLPEGARVYGFLPMAQAFVAAPERVTPAGFLDGAAHRRELPIIYNAYRRLDALPPMEEDMEDRMALLQPLYATSFLLFDYLRDNDWFGAEAFVLSSASSKTAIGLASLLAEAGRKVTGLTSAGNRAFVEGLGPYARVVLYDEIAQALPQAPSVFVDMAGSAPVREAVHARLGDALTRSIAVGTSHWDKFAPGMALPGPKPEFFFAPRQSEKRRAEWGRERIEAEIHGAWERLARDSRRWLKVTRVNGPEAAQAAWAEAAEGRVAPDQGLIVTLD
ncbi:DUF2855 family protein [Oceanicella actignis]|uniref:NADPH-dependent curcumin reductase CurA n=1 Tax=Oceanicella actignis TaxID=1189325 RepID=A0A1M7TS09_9RHOB|nr:DUF2855 family protein [Oceanicella actignis]SET77289.1 Protein of unknown function [Oceanicella actignis]SHN73517.1 Protein of unknown function [Oceanicella actignis]